MQASDQVMTPQEMRIMDVAADNPPTERSHRGRFSEVLNKLRNTPPRISTDRARYFTESFMRTEGKHMTLRWAMALKHTAENLPLRIDDHELIVGRGCGYPGRYGLMFPELEGSMLAQMGRVECSGDENPFQLTGDEADVLNDFILPYWKTRSYHEAYKRSLPDESRDLASPPDVIPPFVMVMSHTSRHSAQWVLDYEKVLQKGFDGLKMEARARLDALDPLDPGNILDKIPFLKAVINTCEAAVILAERYAALAADMAAKEKDPKRRAELLEIAEICRRVPGRPARTFHEALQAQWFTQLLSRLEQKTGGVISNGRMDQYLYPYFKKDMDEGRLDEDSAMELLENLWLCMSQYVEIYFGSAGWNFTEGYAHWEAVTIGGKTKDGRDASNELSHLLLKSKREFPLNYPDLAVRVHSQTSERFLFDVCETIKDGSGIPKLLNDEEIIPHFLSKGATFEEANNYSVSGCSEARMMNRETYFRGVTWINLGAVLEMALNDGRLKIAENRRLGLPTGSAADFSTFEEVFGAFQTQLENAIGHAFIAQRLADKLAPEYLAAPLASMLNDICLDECVDLQVGHTKKGIHHGEFDFVGYGTAIDSLSAIKHLVFEEKRVTMEALLEALNSDFEGREALRMMCLNAPKYGCNNPEADAIGRNIERLAVQLSRKYPMYNGGQMHLRYVPITTHTVLGLFVGATPNGRKSGEYLSEGTAATQGAGAGVLELLLSNAATKNNDFDERASRLLNVKLLPSAVAGDEGTRKMMSIVRSWADLKLWHMQFNIINKETLLAAQGDPEKYRDLIVRVAGYSAYFVDLSSDLQREIIARTEYRL